MLSRAVWKGLHPRPFIGLRSNVPRVCHNFKPQPSASASRLCQSSRYYSSFQRKPGFWYTLWRSIKITWLERPFTITIAYATLIVFVPIVSYNFYQYLRTGTNDKNIFISQVDRDYPEPIAKELKGALFHTNTFPNAERCYDYYKRALQACEELSMSSIDVDVIRIKSTLVKSMRKLGRPRVAIKILEAMKDDCTHWNERINRDSPGEMRTRILRTIAIIDGQLGELYASDPLNDPDAALKHYLSAAELFLREQERRDRAGLGPADEGGWVSATELGASLELSADVFEKKSKHALAAPLYLRALTLAPMSCHKAVLMNNLASALGQTLPEQTPPDIGPATSRTMLIENARAWAQKARELAEAVQGEDRDPECDVACAVATHNLGEFAEMLGMMEDARVKYTEAETMAKGIGFEEGTRNAREGLKRLAKRTAGTG